MSGTPPHLDGLNPEQRLAVETTEGPLLILAGAGSGKTRVLTRRVAHLLHVGIRPWQILAVTFTNKAAGEMRERVSSLVGDQARDVLVSTFHSACTRFLRRQAERVGYPSSFVIYDDDDQQRLLKSILDEMGIDTKRTPPARYRSEIDRAKNRLLTAEDIAADLPRAMRLPEVWSRYEAALRSAHAFDFNDLVNQMVYLLEAHPDVLASFQDRFRYLLVDEFQDTNPAQYRLIRLLAQAHRNLAVVGDDDQSIYSFRGADIRNILDFEKDFPETRVVKLERNYRSTGAILAMASRLVARNQQRKQKTLWTDAPEGEPVRFITGDDEDDEARQVVATLQDLRRRGYKAGEFAVIYRTNASSRPVEQALQRASLPFVLVGGHRFYERREVRDLLGYLRLLVNPSDEMALLRIINTPTRGIGPRAFDRIREVATREGIPMLEAARRFDRETGVAARAISGFAGLMGRLSAALHLRPLDEFVMHVATETGYLAQLEAEETLEAQGRIENIQALARVAGQVRQEHPDEGTELQLQAFLDQATLAGQDEELPDDDGRVTLLTAHLAKGLEFPVVFVIGLVEGVFPHARSQEVPEAVEEERRLAYVCFTRARERLYLCRPRRRRSWSGERGIEDVAPSRFLREGTPPNTEPPPRSYRAPASLAAGPGENPKMATFLRQQRLGAPPPIPAAPQGSHRVLVPESADAFQPGTRVHHPSLGKGRILHRSGSSANPRVLIHFESGHRESFRLSDAQLQIILD